MKFLLIRFSDQGMIYSTSFYFKVKCRFSNPGMIGLGVCIGVFCEFCWCVSLVLRSGMEGKSKQHLQPLRYGV